MNGYCYTRGTCPLFKRCLARFSNVFNVSMYFNKINNLHDDHIYVFAMFPYARCIPCLQGGRDA
jgi:hypothetical protein